MFQNCICAIKIYNTLNLILLVSATWRNTKNGLVNNFTWKTGVFVVNILVQIIFLCFTVVCVYSCNQKLFF